MYVFVQARKQVVHAKNTLRLAQQNLRRLRLVANKKAEQIQSLSSEYRATVQELQQEQEEKTKRDLTFQTYHVVDSKTNKKNDVSMESYQTQLRQKEAEIAEMETQVRSLIRVGMSRKKKINRDNQDREPKAFLRMTRKIDEWSNINVGHMQTVRQIQKSESAPALTHSLK